MTIAHAHLVDIRTTRWYHCVTRCVRAAFSSGKVHSTAKNGSIADSQEELAKIFAISVGGFAVMDNHLHLLVRLRPRDCQRMDAEKGQAK